MNLQKLNKESVIILYGIVSLSFYIFSACATNRNHSKLNYNQFNIEGFWNIDSVIGIDNRGIKLKKYDMLISFSQNQILFKNINDSIGICYFGESVDQVSIILYHSMYEKKFPLINEIVSVKAKEFFLDGKCEKNMKFKTIQYDLKNKDDFEYVMYNLTSTFNIRILNDNMILRSKGNSMLVFLSRMY